MVSRATQGFGVFDFFFICSNIFNVNIDWPRSSTAKSPKKQCLVYKIPQRGMRVVGGGTESVHKPGMNGFFHILFLNILSNGIRFQGRFSILIFVLPLTRGTVLKNRPTKKHNYYAINEIFFFCILNKLEFFLQCVFFYRCQ